MTNASRERVADSVVLDYVGVDMAKQAFVWAVHGVRGAHHASNDEAGFEALLAGAVRVLQQSIEAVIKTLDEQIAKLDKDIDAHLNEHFAEQAKRFEAIKGIGPATCAAILAFMPELGQADAGRAAKLGGLVPLNRDSGQAQGRRHVW